MWFAPGRAAVSTCWLEVTLVAFNALNFVPVAEQYQSRSGSLISAVLLFPFRTIFCDLLCCCKRLLTLLRPASRERICYRKNQRQTFEPHCSECLAVTAILNLLKGETKCDIGFHALCPVPCVQASRAGPRHQYRHSISWNQMLSRSLVFHPLGTESLVALMH